METISHIESGFIGLGGQMGDKNMVTLVAKTTMVDVVMFRRLIQ